MAILQIEVRIECDECGAEETFELADLDASKLRWAMEAEQWERRDDRDLCPECKLEEDEDAELDEGEDDEETIA